MDTFIENVVDFGIKKFKSISDFNENLETLERNVKQLSDKELDEDEHRRAAKLNRTFRKGNNIVIILDDVRERLSLEKLGNPLGVEDCKLILTTPSFDVCRKRDCQEKFEAEELNTDEALSCINH
ncbi:hypothetical protein HAX54_048396 [Datura stramonium]|uniref:NB-ARC domain-containing protein n=1 Tax=Datura stramonium TaxID=4076 RepID=A0ABS8WM40_DATST|nr:hypothetical protein [Datura stramonium]